MDRHRLHGAPKGKLTLYQREFKINNIKVFTLDPDRFPLEKMQELVTYLHDHDQHYIMMVDPAVAYQNYSAFENGEEAGIFLKNNDSSIFQGK